MTAAAETWLVVVCAGRWQMPGIRAAQACGLKVLALDGDADALGLALADRRLVVDVKDGEAVVQAVRQSGIAPSGAVAFVAEAGMRAVAALRDAFDLPGPRSDIVHNLTNKVAQRGAWSKAGLPCPGWKQFSNLADAEEAAARLGGRVIVKPADSGGSRGVTVIEPGEDLRQAAGRALEASRSKTGIVENFIVGVEYTVETISINGQGHVLAVTEKRKVPESCGIVAMELATPDLPADKVAAIGRLAVDALATLGYKEGPGHTEILRSGDGSLWLVEAAGRGGGFMVADGIVPRASGYDLSRACAELAVGRRPALPPAGPSRAIVLRFLPSRPGRVTRISGFEAANAVPGIECSPMVTLGQSVGRPATDGDRMAYILTSHAAREGALSLADRAEATIHIEVEAESA